MLKDSAINIYIVKMTLRKGVLSWYGNLKTFYSDQVDQK